MTDDTTAPSANYFFHVGLNYKSILTIDQVKTDFQIMKSVLNRQELMRAYLLVSSNKQTELFQ